ncbi:GMC oxidoreductase [Alteromonas oceani]|uniref:GMC oxidoreductase n=1 Tax=Alteromonas oceani TaxID=2071609 RepID=A0ABV7JQJ0_9ALTE|nr:GMC oxidoreductase [Alteromonas oceani]
MITHIEKENGSVIECDIAIIGAGTVGLPVSVQIAQNSDLKIVCVESGDEHQNQDKHPLNKVNHIDKYYDGAENGRFRCLGGTSSRWGGALIPFQAADLNDSEWPISLSELEPYIPQLEEMFDLEKGEYTDSYFPYDLKSNHVNRLAKWPAFKKRNVANIFKPKAQKQENLNVYLGATVVGIKNIGDKKVLLTVLAESGKKVELFAKEVIIAAGAIETTRLALLIQLQNDNVNNPNIGKYFSDHLSVSVGEIIPKAKTELNKIIGFRFTSGGGMRNIRFELANNSSKRKCLLPNFTHVGFETNSLGGFDYLREILQDVQKRKFPTLASFIGLLKHSPWFIRAVWWKFYHKRLLFPQNCKLIVHTVVEQHPIEKNRITLSDSEKDLHGSPIANIRWQISQDDINQIIDAAELFKETWNNCGLKELGEYKRFPIQMITSEVENSGGIFHPTSSTKMGHDETSGVVDKDLKMFGAPNIRLLSTSVLPTGGGANPTMMLLLLGQRLVSQLIRNEN